MATPRTFIMRHGETEWSRVHRCTGTTEVLLTPKGEKRVRSTGKSLVGDDKLIRPTELSHIYVSPRHRAQQTLELLDIGFNENFPWKEGVVQQGSTGGAGAMAEVSEDIREWDYGEYEGLTMKMINELRKKTGLGPWLIWRDGCPGGESPQQVMERLDRLISDMRSRFQTDLSGETRTLRQGGGDVMVIAHGHILRAFAMRWIGQALNDEPTPEMKTGHVEVLGYKNHNIDEPIIVAGNYAYKHSSSSSSSSSSSTSSSSSDSRSDGKIANTIKMEKTKAHKKKNNRDI